MAHFIKNIPVSKNYIFFWIFFIINFLFQSITSVIANFINPDLTDTSLHFSGLLEEFYIAVIVAPILETLIFQYIIIESLLNSKIAPIMCVAISALSFGLAHWYNLAYVLVLTGVGFIFGYYYLALRQQFFLNRLIFVVLLHSLSNLLTFLIKNFHYLKHSVK